MFEKDRVLVVDAGNTSVKWTAFVDDLIVWSEKDVHLLSHSLISQQCLTFNPDRIYFASVRSDIESDELRMHLSEFYGDGVCFYALSSGVEACGVRNPYDEPERLGVDRWLNVIAVHHLYRTAAIVVDVGTAVKVEILEDDGCYCGGYIVPGFDMMVSMLVAGTGQVKIRDDDFSSRRVGGDSVISNTGVAVHLGCWQMVLAFVGEICGRHYGKKIIFTGGKGLKVMEDLGIDGEFEAELVAFGAKCLGDELVS